MDDAQPSLSGRAKRQKVDKHGRLSALEKLKQLKGSKHKYEVNAVENVYDEVDEKEYSKTVLKRQTDNWIDDDVEGGYVEDGREIFDDDLDNDSIRQAEKYKESGPRKRKKEEVKNKGNIRSMFMNMSSKKKGEEKIEDDNDLGDLISELRKKQTTPKQKKPLAQNVFCTTTKTNITKSNEKSATVGNLSSELCDTIPSKKIHQNGEDDEPMFDKPTKEPLQKKIDKVQAKVSRNDVNASQLIDDSSDGESQRVTEHEKSVTNDTIPSSQIIEEAREIEDVDFVHDLTYMDFTENVTDADQTVSQNETTASQTKVVEPKLIYKDSKLESDDTEILNQIWDDDFGAQMTEAEVSVNTTDLPLIKNEKGEDVFRFYWWDAFEDPFKQPGVVYLFGKVHVQSAKKYVSCCLTVKNVERRMYLLPREFAKSEKDKENPEPNSLINVYKEFNDYANKNGIKSFRSCTVSKYYAFEREGVPKFSEYLEVKYPATYPPINPNYEGDTFECVFGSSVNALELLLMERNIKGPCWLDVRSPLPAGSPVSWCKMQVNCMKMENISVCRDKQNMPPPPLVVATVNIRTALNVKLHQNEIVMVAVLLHHKYEIDKAPPKPPFEQHFCLITHPRDTPWPMHARDMLSKISHTEVIRCETEFDLLQELLERIKKADPDLIVGCDCGFQYDVLMHRMSSLKVQNWSRIGRLKRTTFPNLKGKINLGQVFCGRPVCDIQVSAKELNLKVRSYDLQSLCVAILKKKESECKEIKPGECKKFYDNAEKIESLLRLTMTEASCIIMIMFELNVMPLALQITCLAGNIISRTLSAGRAERNEFLLLHAFQQKGYITPDKHYTKKGKEVTAEANPRRKKAAYAGGLVLEPKKGFYDKLILLMDFNSLYPSIIQEYNLCFTTVPGAAYADAEDLSPPEADLEPGVVPTEIRRLVESRVEVKKLMKNPNISPELKMKYNIRQLALKLTANSMYGCLGASHCRFYAKGLAALVTAKGREILQNTKHLVEKLNYEVIYGDTDSIMINTNLLEYDEVFTVGKKIKQEVNKMYKKVELDIDGVFRYLLLLQKKKYAAVTMTKLPNGQIEMVQELKGLDIVRRDWCQLACEIGRNVLDQLLCDQSNEMRLEKIFDILQNVAKAVREGQVPLSSLLITKQLSKNPNDYPDKKQAHVSVALRLNKGGGRMWKQGDTVPYIICEDGTDRSAAERAYHVDEFKKSDTLKVDVNYYLLSQIFPVILRICEPIEGIDDVLLADNLGLQGIYKSKKVIHEQEDVEVPLSMNEDRFKYCNHFKFKCIKCQTEITVEDVVAKFPSGNQLALSKCPNNDCEEPPWTYVKAIQNALQLALRREINEYYVGWMECENPVCSNKTRRVPRDFYGNYPRCMRCGDGSMHRIYSETKLYNQMCYFLHIFDLSRPDCKYPIPPQIREIRSAYDTLKEFMEKQLRRNAYSVVDLDRIFASWYSNDQRLESLKTSDVILSSDEEEDDMRSEIQFEQLPDTAAFGETKQDKVSTTGTSE